MAAVYRDNKEFDKAIKSANKAIELDAKNGLYQATLGLVYYKMNNLDQCITALKKASDLQYQEAEVFSVLGNAYLKKDMLDEAIVSYKRALQIDPSLRGARNNLKIAEEGKASKR